MAALCDHGRMFIRLSKTRDTHYVRLLESYRDENGAPRHRQIARLGRLDDFGEKGQQLLDSLNRLLGHGESAGSVEFEAARSVGGTWAMDQLWRQLGLGEAISRAVRSAKRTYDPAEAMRIMVFNRLCDPSSKLGVLRWLEEAVVPGADVASLSHQQLLRAMDAVEKSLDRLRDALAEQIKPLLDQELTVAFYDLTTIRVHGEAQVEGDIRQYGLNKELCGGIARQYMLAVVQSECGLPLDFAVFEGNQSEVKTLVPVLRDTFSRYRIKRAVVVADRGLLSLDNLAELEGVKLQGDAQLQYIVAVPAARYAEMDAVLAGMAFDDTEPSIRSARFAEHRLVVARDPDTAARQSEQRQQKLDELCAWADARAAKLDRQDDGQSGRGRKATDRGAYQQLHKRIVEAKLSRYIGADLQADRFSYSLNSEAIEAAGRRDGTLCVVTNIPPEQLDDAAVIARYKSLADIETGFRVLKSELEIAPVHHRLPRRLKAHAAICFIALLMHRVMRQRLKKAGSAFSVAGAIAQLNRLQQHHAWINGVGYTGVGKLSEAQLDLFRDLGLKKPPKTVL